MNRKTKVSAAVLALAIPVIAHFEGTVYKTYRDPIGIVTACTGHVGPELQMGQFFSKADCEKMLRDDLDKHSADLDCIKTRLNDNQTAAFLSFTFNVGKPKFCGSTLARKANAGDMKGACAELSKWTYAGGRELPGLVKRRAAERELCERPS